MAVRNPYLIVIMTSACVSMLVVVTQLIFGRKKKPVGELFQGAVVAFSIVLAIAVLFWVSTQ